MAIAIKQGQAFYCQTFGHLSIPDELSEGVEISSGIWVSRGLKVVAGDHWEEWLGQLAFRDIRNGLVLTVVGPQRSEGDIINQDLKRKLDEITAGIVLQGVPSYREGFLVGGANQTGEPEARQFSRTAQRYFPTRGTAALTLGREQLDYAVSLAACLERANRQGEDWRRIRRSIDALMAGSAIWNFQDARIHEFVRSLEGLICPEIGKTKGQFVHRCQTFARASSSTETALRAMFDIRSSVEHLNNAMDVVLGNTREEKEDLIYWRARQADRLARFALRHVIENAGLLDIFKTEESALDFWRLGDHERIARWGEQLDLNGIT